MNTPRTCYLPCSTVSWTSNCLKLKKAWKCCLPFLFKKLQRRHWLNEWLPSLEFLYGRASPLHPKTAQRRRLEEVAPRSGREDLSCVEPPEGARKWEHAAATAPQAPQGTAAFCQAHRVSPHGLPGQSGYPNGTERDWLEKLGQGLMLQNLKMPCCPNSITPFKMFLLMLKKWKLGKLSFKPQCYLYKNAQYHIIM